MNPRQYFGFFGFFALFGVQPLLAGDWSGALWLLWVLWFIYFIPRKG